VVSRETSGGHQLELPASTEGLSFGSGRGVSRARDRTTRLRVAILLPRPFRLEGERLDPGVVGRFGRAAQVRFAQFIPKKISDREIMLSAGARRWVS
jgi:hypothetical protein